MIGVGTKRCVEINDFKLDRIVILSWMGGYISAMNVHFIVQDKYFADLSQLNADNMMSSVSAYCNIHPTGRIIDAVDNVLRTLPKRQFRP